MTAGALIIERIRAGATVQDGGRPGHMHEGVPPGEPLVPELFAAANASLGNEPGAAALELPNADALFRVAGEVTVSIDGRPRTLTGSERFQLGAEGEAVRYVALPGGVDVPVVLGGRGTLWVATMGGHEGRILKSGDELRPRLDRPATVTDVHPALSRSEALIRVVPGPDSFDRAVLDAFLSSPFRVGAAGRVGMRLVGTRLPVDGVDADGSRPLVRGGDSDHDGRLADRDGA